MSFDWTNRRVLVTGHTGFKGSWLCMCLQALGAEIHGLALEPPTSPSLYDVAKIGNLLTSDHRVDVRDFQAVKVVLDAVQPEIVFHLAAQSLVNHSYDFPVETFATNVLGTAHVLEAVRGCASVQAALVITTDKCYENREWIHPYRETDRLGGHDPYSTSKACAELVTAAWRNSFFPASPGHVRLATARAGNVIGGGDWAAQRLIPDCVRALGNGNSVTLRYPQAVRPWQHVLEPLAGYLSLVEHLLSKDGASYAQGWNFGPDIEDSRSVGEVAAQVAERLGIRVVTPAVAPERHEAGLLRLDSTLAKQRLGWQPRWRLKRAVAETVDWYQRWAAGDDMLVFSRSQIERYRQGSADE